MALEANAWVTMVPEGERRFTAVWRKEEVDATRHRQDKKREATILGKAVIVH